MSFGFFGRLIQSLPTYLVILGVWFVLAALAYFDLGFRPKSPLGWAGLAALGPLAVILSEAVGEILGELWGKLPVLSTVRDHIMRKTQGKSFSGLRIGWALIEMILILGVIFGAAYLFGLL